MLRGIIGWLLPNQSNFALIDHYPVQSVARCNVVPRSVVTQQRYTVGIDAHAMLAILIGSTLKKSMILIFANSLETSVIPRGPYVSARQRHIVKSSAGRIVGLRWQYHCGTTVLEGTAPKPWLKKSNSIKVTSYPEPGVSDASGSTTTIFAR